MKLRGKSGERMVRVWNRHREGEEMWRGRRLREGKS